MLLPWAASFATRAFRLSSFGSCSDENADRPADRRHRLHRLAYVRRARSTPASRRSCSTISATARRSSSIESPRSPARGPHSSRVTCAIAAALDRVFAEHAIDAVVHFAGLKAVGDSVARPLDYYSNNVCGLGDAVRGRCSRRGVRRLVFSSSATVYGMAAEMPLTEASPDRARRIPTATPS